MIPRQIPIKRNVPIELLPQPVQQQPLQKTVIRTIKEVLSDDKPIDRIAEQQPSYETKTVTVNKIDTITKSIKVSKKHKEQKTIINTVYKVRAKCKKEDKECECSSEDKKT